MLSPAGQGQGHFSLAAGIALSSVAVWLSDTCPSPDFLDLLPAFEERNGSNKMV